MSEPIQVVQEFDSKLKLATFIVNKYDTSEDVNNNHAQDCPKPAISGTGPQTKDVLRCNDGKFKLVKLYQNERNEEGPRFTGTCIRSDFDFIITF